VIPDSQPSAIHLERGQHPGLSLLELTVAIAIGGVLCTILTAAFASTQRFTRLQQQRVAVAEARRVTATILMAELRHLLPSADLGALERDSVALRAFRGAALVCEVAGEVALVRYRGLRAPEPAKDSVLLVGSATDEPAHALLASHTTASGCLLIDGELLYRWNIDPGPEPGTLLLLFESGSYHLSGGALRYRRGASGRQPLTAELFDDHEVGLYWIAPDAEAHAGAGVVENGGVSGLIDGPVAGAVSAGIGIELVLGARPTSDPGPGLIAPPIARYWIGLSNGIR
jgi:type II secretory pathway component PulJ